VHPNARPGVDLYGTERSVLPILHVASGGRIEEQKERMFAVQGDLIPAMCPRQITGETLALIP
jgi:hypothetical protein